MLLFCLYFQAPTKVESGADLYKFISPDLYTVGLIWARRMELEMWVVCVCVCVCVRACVRVCVRVCVCVCVCACI